MAHFLDINQLAEEAATQGLAGIVTMLEEAAQKAAIAIVKARKDVRITDDASNEPGFAGLCVGFGPKLKGERCPADFSVYDPYSVWAEG